MSKRSMQFTAINPLFDIGNENPVIRHNRRRNFCQCSQWLFVAGDFINHARLTIGGVKASNERKNETLMVPDVVKETQVFNNL